MGLSITEYEEMTPYQLNLKIEEYNKRKLLEYKEKISLAYLNSLWTIKWLGKKKDHPKPLKEILNNIGKEKKVMTDENMFKQVMVLNQILGGSEIKK